jgi:hypothetical protein
MAEVSYSGVLILASRFPKDTMETNTSQIAWHHLSIETGSLNDLDQRIAESEDKGYELVTVLVHENKWVAFLKRSRSRRHS